MSEQPDDRRPERPDHGETAPVERASSPREGGSAEPYRVELPEFEGPLDLLLHLIQKHELDILNIPIGFIAQKYFEYIRTMEQLSIDVASDYLVMAATLVHIKSRALLPPDPSAADDGELPDEEEDPRAELVRRLLEYQKYKLAAEQLGGRSVLGRDVFPRGSSVEASSGPAPLLPLSLFKLVDAFEEVLKRAKRVEDHQIDFERISISERIGEISELLRSRGPLPFAELFAQDSSRAEMIVTFLALLEMTKLRMTFLFQDNPLDPIVVELRVHDEAEEGASAGGFSWADDEVPARHENSEPDEQDVLARHPAIDDVFDPEGELDDFDADDAPDEPELPDSDDSDAPETLPDSNDSDAPESPPDSGD